MLLSYCQNFALIGEWSVTACGLLAREQRPVGQERRAEKKQRHRYIEWARLDRAGRPVSQLQIHCCYLSVCADVDLDSLLDRLNVTISCTTY